MNWLIQHWYLFIIVILGAVALKYYTDKKRLERELHSEVAEHHKIVTKEMKLSNPEVKWLTKKGKILAKIKGMIIKPVIDTIVTKGKNDKGETIETVEKVEKKFIVLSLAMNNLFKLFWIGDEHLTLPFEYANINKDRNRLELNPNIQFDQWLGYEAPLDNDTRTFIFSEYYRTMFDKTVNGMGNQMTKFSEVRDIWGHEMAVKEMEIEKLKEEKKLSGTRAR